MMRFFASLTFACLGTQSLALAADAPPFAVDWWPKRVRAGTAALVEIKAKNATVSTDGLSLCLGDQTVAVFDCSRPNSEVTKCAIVPVPFDRKAGELAVQLIWKQGATSSAETFGIPVTEGKYRISKLKVPPNMTKPSAEEQARIEAERKDLAVVFAAAHPSPLWDGVFALPTKGNVTSNFGNQRVFNGEMNSVHLGVDLRAQTGVKIHSPNIGRVVAAKNFFSAGNMVVLDHGAGVFSSYAHLSKIKVLVGDIVKKGDLLGLAGGTGRATGPHLHWAMRVAGVPVDPTQMLTIFQRLKKKTTFKASLSSAAGTRLR